MLQPEKCVSNVVLTLSFFIGCIFNECDGRCVLQPENCVSDVVLTCCHCFVVWSVMAMDDVFYSLKAACQMF